jgi:transposase
MGANWRKVPEQFESWRTVYTRDQEWRHSEI